MTVTRDFLAGAALLWFSRVRFLFALPGAPGAISQPGSWALHPPDVQLPQFSASESRLSARAHCASRTSLTLTSQVLPGIPPRCTDFHNPTRYKTKHISARSNQATIYNIIFLTSYEACAMLFQYVRSGWTALPRASDQDAHPEEHRDEGRFAHPGVSPQDRWAALI